MLGNRSPSCGFGASEIVEADGSQHSFDDRVRIAVGAWATIFEVAAAIVGDASGNSDGASAVGNTGVEVVDG